MAVTHDPGAKRGAGARVGSCREPHPRRLAPRRARRRPHPVHLPAPVRTALRLHGPAELLGRVPDLPPRRVHRQRREHVGLGRLRPHLAPREHRRSAPAARRRRRAPAAPRAHVHVGPRASPAHGARRGSDPVPPSCSAWSASSRGCSPSAAPSYAGTGVRVAVVGAGTNGAAALREMQQSPMLGLVPVVAVDDDPGLRDRSIHGVPIAGTHRRPRPRSSTSTTSTRCCSRCPSAPPHGRPAGRRHRRSRQRPGARAAGVVVVGPRHAAAAGAARPQHRGPARPPAGRPRPRAGAQAPARPARARHRRRRVDRRGDRPPGRASSAPSGSCSSTTTRPTSTTRSTACRASPSPRSRSPTSATRR